MLLRVVRVLRRVVLGQMRQRCQRGHRPWVVVPRLVLPHLDLGRVQMVSVEEEWVLAQVLLELPEVPLVLQVLAEPMDPQGRKEEAWIG